jgi:hypothetical protein
MALDNNGIPADAFELRVRFGVGFVVGALIGAASVLQLGDASMSALGSAALGVGVVVGLLARYYGDRFWYALRWWF